MEHSDSSVLVGLLHFSCLSKLRTILFCVHLCVCICVHMYMRVHMCVLMYVYVYVCALVYVCMCICGCWELNPDPLPGLLTAELSSKPWLLSFIPYVPGSNFKLTRLREGKLSSFSWADTPGM